MRWLRRHFRRILALISSYAVGNAVFLGAVGLANRVLLGGRIKTLFMYYPATEAYADLVAYRWHQRRFGWFPGLVGLFVQNGRIGLCFAVPNTEAQFKDQANTGHVATLMQRMDGLRHRIGAEHRTFAGILPSIFHSRGIQDRDVVMQRNMTARAVLAALDEVIAGNRLPADVPVLLLGGRGFVGSHVQQLCVGRNVSVIDANETDAFRALIRPLRGHPLVIVNLTKAGVLADYLEYFWPGLILLNEVYPEPSRCEVRAAESLGSVVYHISGVEAWCWPPFPRAYRGGIPCCASVPLGADERVAVVVTRLSSTNRP